MALLSLCLVDVIDWTKLRLLSTCLSAHLIIDGKPPFHIPKQMCVSGVTDTKRVADLRWCKMEFKPLNFTWRK